MSLPENNLFLRLHKWASRQDENFLTETFAFLLEDLLLEEPVFAVELLRLLTKGFFDLRPDEAKAVNLRTQITLEGGTPDLEIRTSRQLAFVEVKSEARASVIQLRKYRELLAAEIHLDSRLILLTRYHEVFDEAESSPDLLIRWHEVQEWLRELGNRYTLKPVSMYFVTHFVSFLGFRNMTMTQITWEVVGGLRAVRNCMEMLYEAAKLTRMRVKWQTSSESVGVYLEGGAYWVGMNYDQPEYINFVTWKRTVDKEAASRLPEGEVRPWDDVHYQWIRTLDLNSPKIYFLALNRARQLQVLEEFIRESVAMVRPVELPTTLDRAESEEPAPSSDE